MNQDSLPSNTEKESKREVKGSYLKKWNIIQPLKATVEYEKEKKKEEEKE